MSSYPLLDAFVTMLWFFLWMLWIFLVVRIIMDVFGSEDLGGWAKAGWVLLVIVLPLLGVLIYLIARGGGMRHRQEYDMQAVASASELSTLADLRDRGVISDLEFELGKEKILH